MQNKLYKQYFLNFKFIISLLVLITSIILLVLIKRDSSIIYNLIRGGFFASFALIGLTIINYLREYRYNNKVIKFKKKIESIKPITISNLQFVEECKNGIKSSLIKINGKTYFVETRLNQEDPNDLNKLQAFINQQTIIGLNNFLDFLYDGSHRLKDLRYIDFILYDDLDANQYFEKVD